MGQLIFRKYKEGDEKQIVSLLKLVFKLQRFDDLTYWEWMYKNNPIGLSKIWVAENDGEIVGHYALIPIRIKGTNSIHLGTLTINLAIHPDYQHHGIFPLLAEKAHKELCQEGILFSYCYPNNNSYPIFINKLLWIKIDTLPMLFRPLNLKLLIKRKINNKYLSELIYPFGMLFTKKSFRDQKYHSKEKINIKKATSFDERLDSFFKEASKEYKHIIVRDQQFLTWRYLNNPNYNYTIYLAEKNGKVLGFIVLKTIPVNNSNSGMIVDLLTLPHHECITFALVSKAINFFEKENADVITCFVQSKYYYDLLRKLGFIPIPFLKPKICIKNNTQKKTILPNVNWFITNGDALHED
jgi:predicted N-acetyltransferase YhbS